MRYNVEISKFDGGLNTKASIYNLQPNESPSCANVVIDEYGALKTVNGLTRYTSSSIETHSIDGLHSYVNNSLTKQLLAVCAGTVYRMSGNTAVMIGSAQSVFTWPVNVEFLTYQNQAFLSNGYNSYKWNGTEFTRWGVSAPSAATAVIDSAGTLTGSYRYVVFGINSNSVKGVYGSATAEIVLAGNRGYLTEIPVFPASAGVNFKGIARNTAGVSGIYWIVTQIANATTVYQDNNSDSILVTLAPVDGYPPDNFTTFCECLGYVFGANKNGSHPSFLYYSNINDPETFDANDYIRIGESDGMIITAILPFASGIAISKSDFSGSGTWYLLDMPNTTPTNWSLRKLDVNRGAESVRGVIKFINHLVFNNRYGIYALNEQELSLVKMIDLSSKIEDQITVFDPSSCSAIVYKNKIYLSKGNGITLIYDPGIDKNSGETSAWTQIVSSVSIGKYIMHDASLYGSDLSLGMIYLFDTGANFDGSAFSSYYYTAVFEGLPEHKDYSKLWRKVHIKMKTNSTSAMRFEYLTNLLNLNAAKNVIWEDSSSSLVQDVSFEIDAISKKLQLRISNQSSPLNSTFTIYGISIEYILRGKR